MEEKFIISSDIKAATKECRKNFSCLTENGKEMGKVVFCVDCRVLGILCNSDEPCFYRYSVDERTYCICPMRKEIYAKYKL